MEEQQDLLEMMAEVNERLSLFTAFSTWKDKWHTPHMEIPEYSALFNDAIFVIRSAPLNLTYLDAEDTVIRIFYVLSMSPDATMSLATLASKLDADCRPVFPDYEGNMTAFSHLIYAMQTIGIFVYSETATGHPVLEPMLQVKGELRRELDAKFASAIPQIGEVVGYLGKDGTGLLPGVKFKGSSTRRKTPLNTEDRKAVSVVSRQKFKVDMDIVRKMEYYVPTLSRTGKPISEREQEDTRTAYYRFTDMAEQAEELDTVIQFPTTQDSRGRFYNAATDPSVRLSLRSPKPEGWLNAFEHKLLRS